MKSWRRSGLAAVLTIGMVASLIGLTPTVAGAAPGDALPELPAKTVSPASADPGQLIDYTINYTCSNNEASGDGCDGSVFRDPIPKITNVYGEVVPLELVSATGPATVWPGGFTLDTTTDPANPAVVSTAGTWGPGDSGSIFITLRVPPSSIPEGTQVVTNRATVTDPEDGDVSTSPEASTTVVAEAPEWTVAKTGPSTGTRLNRDYQWKVSVCGPGTSALWPVFEITDTVPEGFQFTSAERGGTFTDDAVADGISDGTATVTWTFDAENRPPLGSDGCFSMLVTGRFPSSHASNVDDAEKTNVVTGVGRYLPTGAGTGLGTAPWTTTLTGPVFGGAGTAKTFTDVDSTGANFYVTDGDTGQFNLSTSVDSDFLLDRVVLTDGQWTLDGGPRNQGLPVTFTATSLDPGQWNDPVTATIRASNDAWATSTVIASGVASGAADITLGTSYRAFRWEWDGPGAAIRGDFSATGLAIVGTVSAEGPADHGRYRNISRVDVVPDGAPPVSGEGFDDYLLEPSLPHADISKSASSTSRQPGQQVTYTVRVTNNRDATGSLADPEVTDCVPEHLTVLEVNAPAPWTADPLGTCGPGGNGTALHFTWGGTLNPSQATSNITYRVQVAPSVPGPAAPYGRYSNTAIVSPSGGGSFAHCVDTNPVCGDTVTVVVTPTVELASAKCVRGELDEGTFRPTPRCTPGQAEVVPALTTPGGEITYRLDLENRGNTDAANIDFIDILPHVGDTAVITGTGGVLNQRRSEYAPLLIAPIAAPTGWTVAYSTSANPCRPEVGGPSTGCDAPGWTTTPDPLALSSYRSIKLSHPGVLAQAATASFEWTMRAPATDPTYDAGGTDDADPYEHLHGCDAYAPAGDPDHCPRAVNSFAYGADAANLPGGTPQPARLYAEPPQVEVRVTDPEFANSIGDRVWFDRDYDGIQAADTTAAGEPGVAGVRVELWEADGTEPLATTFTDDSGAYLFNSIDPDGDATFTAIPDGDYFVRFFPPAGWHVSPQSAAGAGTDEDSDVPRAPASAGDLFRDTAVTNLGDEPNVDLDDDGELDGESDPTWDMGIWRPVPGVEIVKKTRDSAWPVWADADTGDGVHIIQGREVTWDYTVTNTGNSRLEDVTVTDDGGPGDAFTVTDCTIVDGGANSDGLTSSATAPIALNRGAVMTCTATGTAGLVDYANTGTVAGTPVLDDGTELPDEDPVDDDDPSSYVSGAYDLALAKIVGIPDLATGDVSFTVTVANQGTVASGAYTVTDVLPAGISFTSATPTPSDVTGQVITWDLDDLAVDATTSITINAHIDDYRAGPFRNHAEISADSAALVQTNGVLTPTTDVDSTPENDPTNGDSAYYGPVGEPAATDNASITDAGVAPDTEDDEDIADLVPAVEYDLALAKVADATALTADDEATITYTVTVENQGNVPSGAYTVTDTLAPGLTPVTPIPGGGAYDPVDHVVTWTGASLQPAATADFTFEVTVTDLTQRPYRNVAEVSADSAQALYGVDDVDSTPDADVTNDNAGNGIEEGDGYGPVGDPAGGGVDNITTADSGTGTDGEDDADIADVNLPLTGAYDVALAKTVDAAEVGYGDTITYTVTVQNQGILDSREVEVTDTVPAGLEVTDLGGATDNSDGTLTWTIENLEPGETVTLTFTATIADFTERPYRNFAEISADSADYYTVEGETIADADSTPDADTTNDGDYGEIGSLGPLDNVDEGDEGAITQAGVDPDPEDDADIADVTTQVRYDLALIKQGPATMTPMGTATFTITVQNQGNVPSGLYDVTDVVPEGMEAVDASDEGTISADGDQVVWTDRPSLDPGATAELSATTRITDFTLRPFTNFAEITADSADTYSTETEEVTDSDSVPDDETTSGVDVGDFEEAGAGDDEGFDDEDIATVTTTVVYDLSLDKRLLPDQRYRLGDVVRYEIEVTNEGNVPSGPFSVSDTLPAGMELATASHGGSAEGQAVIWTDLASLDPEASTVLTVGARLTDVTKASYVNVAEVTDDSADDYSTDGEEITDRDSTPGEVLGEDDEDRAEIPVSDILADNATRGADLPRTGSPLQELALLAGLALLSGAGFLALTGRRRRRPRHRAA